MNGWGGSILNKIEKLLNLFRRSIQKSSSFKFENEIISKDKFILIMRIFTIMLKFDQVKNSVRLLAKVPISVWLKWHLQKRNAMQGTFFILFFKSLYYLIISLNQYKCVFEFDIICQALNFTNQQQEIHENIKNNKKQQKQQKEKNPQMSTNLAATTKTKVSQLYPQSFAQLKINEKKNLFFIGHKNGLNVYDISSNKIQEIKLDKSQYPGPFSCFTISDELIFFCCGSKVIAMGTNFKIIFELDTYLAVDKIDSIHVFGYRMFLISENMLNQFLIGGVQIMNKKSRITQSPNQKSEDIQQQVFDSNINHSVLVTQMAQKPFLLLLKSSNQIQTFQKKQSEASLQTNSPPTYASKYPQNQQNEDKYLIGTANGQILYLEVSRKSIKKIWAINQTKGKINTICELRNGFFVARDKVVQFWSKNRQLLKQQSVSQKTICSCYLSQEELLIYGTTNGNVIQMQNYQKFIKESKKLNQAKQRLQIVKQIELLRYKKDLLHQKIAAKKGAEKEKVVAASSLKKINVKSQISIDYVNLCYNIELQSDEKICKVICQGSITLLQQKQDIYFQGTINQGKIRVYILRYQNETNIQLKVKYQEVYNELDKLNLLVYFSYQTRVHNIQIDLKQLSLHQKVGTKSFNQKNPYLNKLQISGNFKFQMKMWLNNIFNEFISQQIDQYEVACYQSVITKNKVLVKFKPGSCLFLAESVISLLIIKKKLLQKAKQKNLSLSFDTFTNPQSIKDFILNIQKRMKQFIQTKSKYQLIPGLLQLKNDISLEDNQDLFKILEQRESITSKYKQNLRMQSQIREKIVQLYKSFKILNNKNTLDFEQKSISSSIERWDTKAIISTICGG